MQSKLPFARPNIEFYIDLANPPNKLYNVEWKLLRHKVEECWPTSQEFENSYELAQEAEVSQEDYTSCKRDIYLPTDGNIVELSIIWHPKSTWGTVSHVAIIVYNNHCIYLDSLPDPVRLRSNDTLEYNKKITG